ncbi:hypothetical protein Ahy_A08g039516 [Arachis hypogaea]|uniref:Uncharacterized protein n=1 Tax=Arachis hypogaea TaxID=3818 RepID=A0A445BWI9_ARAHY|nr:hypothetical protein Ahy_A08g039516 [Arachis hypogaea]
MAAGSLVAKESTQAKGGLELTNKAQEEKKQIDDGGTLVSSKTISIALLTIHKPFFSFSSLRFVLTENNQFFFVVVYPSGIVRHADEGVIFESDKIVMLRTYWVDSLDALNTILLSNMGGVGTKEVGFLNVLSNGGFTNWLFWIDGDQHVRVMFNVHARLIPQHVMELYAAIRNVVVSGGQSLSTPEVVPLKAVPIHYAQPYGSADEDNSKGDLGPGHQAIQRPKMSLYQRLPAVVLGGTSVRWITYLSGTYHVSGHAQLNSGLICKVMLPMIKTDPSVSILVLQSVVHQSYHFNPSYRKVWMANQKATSKIYGNWEESYNRIPALLQALQECLPELPLTIIFNPSSLLSQTSNTFIA